MTFPKSVCGKIVVTDTGHTPHGAERESSFPVEVHCKSFTHKLALFPGSASQGRNQVVWNIQ